MEEEKLAARWAAQMNWTFPVLLDRDGETAEAWAPEGVLPDIKRNQVAIASNVIVDREGRIAFFTLLDSQRFDARLTALRSHLETLLEMGDG